MQNIRLLLVIVAKKTATEILLRMDERTRVKQYIPVFFEAGV
jgi:hypothetical protein